MSGQEISTQDLNRQLMIRDNSRNESWPWFQLTKMKSRLSEIHDDESDNIHKIARSRKVGRQAYSSRT
jgi:hypothetical protein